MDKSTIILSIHPNHIKRIFTGEKMYEYRKYLPEGIKYIIVYATAPIKLVVAIIEIEKIIKGDIEKVWRTTHEHAGITKSFYQQYFDKHQTAYAAKFKSVYKIKTPVSLFYIGSNIHAPQSFIYCDSENIFKIFDIEKISLDDICYAESHQKL